MAYKIALATSDGKVVNQHFGRCPSWTIIEIDEDSSRFLEKREIAAACAPGGHDDNVLGAVIDALSDCRAALAARIGQGAAVRLEARGIAAFECGEFVDDAIAKVSAYYKRTADKR
jgi:predicted Fe-Mo cluster-binding NifX family protein